MNRNSDEKKLIRMAKRGDFTAFEELISISKRRLYSLVMSVLQNEQDAEDVLQVTYLKALNGIDNFREDSSFSSWVIRIGINTAISLYNKRKQTDVVNYDEEQEQKRGSMVIPPSFISRWENEPAFVIERVELMDFLKESIKELPENHRLVFTLRDVQGFSVKETAASLDMTAANVKVCLLRARLELRETLTRKFGNESTRLAPSSSAGPTEEKLLVSLYDDDSSLGGAE